MFSFFKKKNNEPDTIDIPEWAAFFTPEAYTAFLAGIDSYFKEMKVTYKIENGVVEVDPKNLRFSRLGLSNVAQACRQSSPGHYADIISEYLTPMLKALEIDKTFDENMADFEKIKPYLAIRLHNEEYMAYTGRLDEENQTTVSRFIADDVYATLAFDLPDAIRNVSPSHVSSWGIDEDTLFSISAANTRANHPMQITQEDMGGFHIWFVNNDHVFTANIIYELEDRPELTGSKGALIAIPHRHSAIIYPIEDLGIIEAIRKMIPAAYNLNQEGPGSLTPNLFLYRDGAFTRMPYEVRDDKLHFMPPESFLDLLNELESQRR